MKLICIVGEKGSGKSTFLDIASTRKHSIEEIDWGYKNLIQNQNKMAMTLPPQNEWKEDVIKVVFEQYWIKKYSNNSTIFFTGLYKPSEIYYLKNLESVELQIVSIHVKENLLRHERILKRSRAGEENLTLKDLIRKDKNRRGISKGYYNNNITELMRIADYRISNDGTIAEFVSNSNRLIEKIEINFIGV